MSKCTYKVWPEDLPTQNTLENMYNFSNVMLLSVENHTYNTISLARSQKLGKPQLKVDPNFTLYYINFQYHLKKEFLIRWSTLIW